MALSFILLTKEYASVCANLDVVCFTSTIFSKELLESMLDSPNLVGFLVVNGEDVLGYAIASFVENEAELLSIAILPDHQGKGHGKGLLQHLLKVLQQKNVTVLFLEVRHSNIAAQKIYEYFGGVRVGERKAYYDNPTEDAYVYKLEINA